MAKNITVKGKKGGEAHQPYEAPNTLQATSTARLVDLLCEGEIEGPAINDSWDQSTYYDEIPVQQNSGTYNYEGTVIQAVKGEPYASQDAIPGFSKVQKEQPVAGGSDIQFGTPVVVIVNDLTVDDVRVTMEVNGLLQQTDEGDMNPYFVNYHCDVIPGDGLGTPVTVFEGNISGKTTSRYRKAHIVENLSQYGTGPWYIKLYRDSVNSTNSKIVDKLNWSSYTLIKNAKLAYPDSVIVGQVLDAKKFGNQIPNRAWRIKGLKIQYPKDVYTPATFDLDGNMVQAPSYDGVWNGSFTTGYCTNPAWVVYDLLTNERYGLGLEASQVDKWALYSIAQYCDACDLDGNFVGVSVSTAVRGTDYDATSQYTISVPSLEPRFTFNGVISTREQALAVVTHLCSVFRGFPIWGSGFVSFVQDSPKEISRIASPANVLDGNFEYQGTPRQQRHTAIKVSYNDPNNFSKLEVVVIEDEEGIQKYGYNPMDIVAFGCNKRSEAIRRGRYILYSDINQTETVSFRGGYEWADCIPGEVIGVQDPDYSLKNISGRIVSATEYSVTVDRDIVIESGATYTLYVQIATTGEVTEQLLDRTLTNSPGTTRTLTWAKIADTIPKAQAVFVLRKSTASGTLRTFQVIGVKETELTEFEVSAALYIDEKYQEIEDGIVIEAPPVLDVPSGQLDPPSNILIQPYTYPSGDDANRKYALVISWIGSPDPRTTYYSLEYKSNQDTPYEVLKYTGDNQFDWKDVKAGEYDFRVQARSLTAASTYTYYNNFTLGAYVGEPLPPTNLRTNEGSDQFSGRDCHILWDPSEGSGWTPDDNTGVLALDSTSIGDSNIVGYKVEVWTVADSLLRTFITASKLDTEYVYTYEMNLEDTVGLPNRQIKFKVYTQDAYGDVSEAVTMVASNPVPDMSSATPVVDAKPAYLKVTWTKVNDNDMDHYNVFCDENNPPTTLVGTVIHPDDIIEVFDLLFGTTYYTKVVPYDKFGVGTASQVSGGLSPLQIPDINIDIELTGSIDITTDSTSYVGDLNALYDGTLDSTGVTFTSPEDKYVQYRYRITNYFDRMAVWAQDDITSVYFGLSFDTGETWEYFAGLYEDSEGYNHLASYGDNQASAKANAWDLSAGFNTAKIPNNKVAYRVRMYFASSTDTEIFEFIPSRIIISELAAIQNLAAVTADLGTVIAGNVQSADYSLTEGFNIDLNEKAIYMGGYQSPIFQYDSVAHALFCTGQFIFKLGSAGWDNVEDAQRSTTNLMPYSNFSGGVNGWTKATTAGATTFGVDLSVDWKVPNSPTAYLQQINADGDPATDYTDIYLTTPIPAEAGVRYCLSGYIGVHRCSATMYIAYYDVNDTVIGYSDVDSTTVTIAYSEGYVGGKELSGYKRCYVFSIAPANTAKIRGAIRKFVTDDGETTSYLFTTRLMLSTASPTQIVVPDWSAYGTDTTLWQTPSDITKIDGGNLYVGSQITLREGGKATFGNNNVVIDTAGNTGRIEIAPDGGKAAHDYCELTQGDINYYLWNGSSHVAYKSLTNMQVGTASNNTTVVIPGYFKAPPKVIISPCSLQSYNAANSTQSQKLRLEAKNLRETYTGSRRYQFTAVAYLDKEAGGTGGLLPYPAQTASYNTGELGTYFAISHNNGVGTDVTPYFPQLTTGWQSTPSGTTQLTVNFSYYRYIYDQNFVYSEQSFAYSPANYYIVLDIIDGYQKNQIATFVHTNTQYNCLYDDTRNANLSITGSNISNYRIRMLPSTGQYFYQIWLWGRTIWRGLGNNAHNGITVTSYSTNQSASTGLASGTLNWMAIGS